MRLVWENGQWRSYSMHANLKGINIGHERPTHVILYKEDICELADLIEEKPEMAKQWLMGVLLRSLDASGSNHPPGEKSW